ncbi:hypothetical protein F0562_001179 [Nyssa sinensis]|uniref:Transcription repressor n=1 Tax=Nyssa sinensis TaxID=561372 RepID=A0A5J5C263_9ASTE|nr:hypothetical protein F0562_001179 [Nyssa sinensis]
MGNYRFRLSDMMPNAWFYKLRDMSKTRIHTTSQPVKQKLPSTTATSQKPYLSQPRHSYYYNSPTEPIRAEKIYNSPTNPKASDTHFPDPPRKSSKKINMKRKTIYKPSPRLVTSSVSANCNCHAALNSIRTKPEPIQGHDYFVSPIDCSPETNFLHSPLSEFESDSTDASDSFNKLASWSRSCSCRVSSSTADIIIDMNEKSYSGKSEKLDGFDSFSELDLPPILTKPAQFNNMISEATKFRRSSSELEEIEAHASLSIKIVKEETIKTQKETKTSPLIGEKLRANSPRIARKKIQASGRRKASSSRRSNSGRKSYSMSFAIVKSSFDPQKDFKDSMAEMIVENNIRASKDLEELLACYLSLNSNEYHGLIVKAFEQIWFDMAELRT